MAELLLKVGDRGPDPDYRDGDILCAFNARRIRCCHAQHLCHVRTASRNSSGLIVNSDLARDWFEATHQFRFERISPTQVRRRNLWTADEDMLSGRPNDRGEAIDVGLFVRRRKRNPSHRLFGVDGREVWYGGKIDLSEAALTTVWQAIEGKSQHREQNYRRWPAGVQERKSHLLIETDEFDDAAGATLESPEAELQQDEAGADVQVTVRKRRHGVDWRRGLSLTAADIEAVQDRTREFDLRERGPFLRAQIVAQKPTGR